MNVWRELIDALTTATTRLVHTTAAAELDIVSRWMASAAMISMSVQKAQIAVTRTATTTLAATLAAATRATDSTLTDSDVMVCLLLPQKSQFQLP